MFCLLDCIIINSQWWKETRTFTAHTAMTYNSEVLEYFIFCYFIPLLHCISEGNIAPYTIYMAALVTLQMNKNL